MSPKLRTQALRFARECLNWEDAYIPGSLPIIARRNHPDALRYTDLNSLLQLMTRYAKERGWRFTLSCERRQETAMWTLELSVPHFRYGFTASLDELPRAILDLFMAAKG